MSSPSPSSGHSAGELRYLSELLQEFGVVDHPPSNVAVRQIEVRYDRIMDAYPDIIQQLARLRKGSSSAIFVGLDRELHGLLFEGILANAGEYRKSTDAHGGNVGFGGVRPQGHRSRFRGTPPGRIASGLEEAFAALDGDGDVVEQAVRFYMRFNRVHPFYDANGRISRVLVSMYLYLNGKLVRWKELDKKKNKFISKMNECHKRHESGFRHEIYFGYLMTFFRQYVGEIDSLLAPDEER